MYYMKLRRLELLANYGDYLGQELKEIWADLKAVATVAGPEVQKAAQGVVKRLGKIRKCTRMGPCTRLSLGLPLALQSNNIF